MKANYQLIIDNLLDLTHVSYVHKNTLAGDPREATTPTKTERLPDGVKVGRWMLDFAPPPLFAKAGNFKDNVDRWQFVTWTPPTTVVLDVGCATTGTGAPQGDRSHGISIWSTYLVTPETEETSQYMFSYARDFALDDAEMGKLLYEGSRATFMEDADIIEAVQTNCEGGSLDGLIHINADAAQLQARRFLQKLIDEERAQSQPSRLSRSALPALSEHGFSSVTGNVETLHRKLSQRNVDLLIARRFGPIAEERLGFEFLFDDSSVVAAGAQTPWARRRRIEFAELLKELWVLPPPGSEIASVSRASDASWHFRGLSFRRIGRSCRTCRTPDAASTPFRRLNSPARDGRAQVLFNDSIKSLC